MLKKLPPNPGHVTQTELCFVSSALEFKFIYALNKQTRKMGVSQTQIAIIFFITTCIFIQSGFAIKCWVCRSDSDPKCADPFDNSSVPITDCKQEPELEHLPGVKPTMCRKIRQKVNGVWRYFRSCAYMGEPGIEGDERFCLMRTGTYNIFMEYCTCNSKDGCNTGSGLSFTPLLYITVTAVIPVLYKVMR